MECDFYSHYGQAYIHFLFFPCLTISCFVLILPRALVSWIPSRARRIRCCGKTQGQKWRQDISPCLTHLVSLHLRQWLGPCHGSIFYNSSVVLALFVGLPKVPAPVDDPSFGSQGTIPPHSPRWGQLPFIWLLFIIYPSQFPLINSLYWNT